MDFTAESCFILAAEATLKIARHDGGTHTLLARVRAMAALWGENIQTIGCHSSIERPTLASIQVTKVYLSRTIFELLAEVLRTPFPGVCSSSSRRRGC